MGPAISSIIVSLVSDDLFTYAVGKLTFHVPFDKRYVDDFLLALPLPEIDTVLQTYNIYNNDIQFTFENEINNSI